MASRSSSGKARGSPALFNTDDSDGENVEPSPPSKTPARQPGTKEPKKRPRLSSSPRWPVKKPKAEYVPVLGGLMSGLKVVVTGTFDNRSRIDMEDAIKRLGGQVMSAVSSRTDVLLHGSKLEDGRGYAEGSKYRKAKELLSTGKAPKLQIMDESQFENQYLKLAASQTAVKDQVDAPEDLVVPGVKQETYERQSGVPAAAVNNRGIWAERWRPKSTSDIIGNGDVVHNLIAWLEHWEDACLRGIKRTAPFSRGRLEPDLVNARSAFLSGPPGVGKTTAAKVAAETAGLQVIEFNASDDRGKGIVEVVGEMTSGGSTITDFFKKSDEGVLNKAPKHVLIMDEMDGMSAGDRGGAQALLKLIEKSRIPVICIANDRMHAKVRTLAAKSYDLRFHKPPKNSIAKRLVQIAHHEGLQLEPNAAETLVESVGNDIRQCLNVIQFMAMSRARVSYDDMRSEVARGLKDEKLMSNPFEMGRKLLTASECRGMSLLDRLDGYFIDTGLMPLMIQQNYFLAVKNKAGSEADKIELTAKLSESFSQSDIASSSVYRGNWGLVTSVALHSVIAPSVRAASFVVRPEFPAWLGKNSTTVKNRRLVSELSLFLSSATSNPSRAALIVDGIVHNLYDRLMEALKDDRLEAKDRALRSIDILDEYGISRNHLIEHMTALRLKRQPNSYENVDKRVKTAFTTTYNNTSHAIKMAPPSVTVFRTRPSASQEEPDIEGGVSVESGSVLHDDPPERDVDEDDMTYIDRLIVASKKKKPKYIGSSSAASPAKAKAKAKAKSKSRAKAKASTPLKPPK